MSELSPVLARMLELLEAAGGDFVPGQVLAKQAGIPMISLGNFIKEIRLRRPELEIEGKRGFGYALKLRTSPVPVLVFAAAPEFDPPRKPRQGGGRSYRQPKGAPAPVPMHIRMAASMAMLDLIPAKAAEILKVIALESGEITDETLLRLLSYGCEVHRDMIAGGENPLALRAPRTQEREASRHEG